MDYYPTLIEPLHLAAAFGRHRPESDASQRLCLGIACQKQFALGRRVLAREIRQFLGEALVGEVDAQRGGIRPKQRRCVLNIGSGSDGFTVYSARYGKLKRSFPKRKGSGSIRLRL